MQNRKLSGRLRERNRQQEQLEERVEKLVQTHDKHLRLLALLRRHLGSVREHLTLLLAPLGEGTLLEGWTEECLEHIGEEDRDVLDTVFGCVFSALRCLGDGGYSQLCEALREGGDMAEVGQSTMLDR